MMQSYMIKANVRLPDGIKYDLFCPIYYQRKTTFLRLIVVTHRIVPTRLQAMCIHFVLYNAS